MAGPTAPANGTAPRSPGSGGEPQLRLLQVGGGGRGLRSRTPGEPPRWRWGCVNTSRTRRLSQQPAARQQFAFAALASVCSSSRPRWGVKGWPKPEPSARGTSRVQGKLRAPRTAGNRPGAGGLPGVRRAPGLRRETSSAFCTPAFAPRQRVTSKPGQPPHGARGQAGAWHQPFLLHGVCWEPLLPTQDRRAGRSRSPPELFLAAASEAAVLRLGLRVVVVPNLPSWQPSAVSTRVAESRAAGGGEIGTGIHRELFGRDAAHRAVV